LTELLGRFDIARRAKREPIVFEPSGGEILMERYLLEIISRDANAAALCRGAIGGALALAEVPYTARGANSKLAVRPCAFCRLAFCRARRSAWAIITTGGTGKTPLVCWLAGAGAFRPAARPPC
jgi:hypothetical protein